jgi:hypothetical protein
LPPMRVCQFIDKLTDTPLSEVKPTPTLYGVPLSVFSQTTLA